MAEERVPRWHSIEALPMISEAIDGMLDSAEDVVGLEPRPRPHILDDDTIGRVREAHGTQLNDLWWNTEQFARWQQASPTPAQTRELTRLGGQLEALRRTLTTNLALAEELQAGTIEKIGSFHETAKVVNSVRVSTAGITRCTGRVSPLDNCSLDDVRCESREGDLGGFSIHG